MKYILLLLFFCSINIFSSGYGQQLSNQDEAYIDSAMTANYKSDGPGAILLIAKDGKAIFRKAYGLANLELKIPNKPEYLFRIGSMTKQFVAVCILKLAQEGKLSLDDDIRKYLPDYNTYNRAITINNLLSHTSGITDYTSKPDFLKQMAVDHSKKEIMDSFMKDSLLFEPGTNWSYSNSGYVLAGLILEKITEMSLGEYLQKNVFDPLGMTNTYIGTFEKLIPNTAYGYSLVGKDKFAPASYTSWSWAFAAGDIISNVDDLLKWDEALYTEKIVKKEWLEKAWSSYVLLNKQMTNYGFGWTTGMYKELSLITHDGGFPGFLCSGIRIPSQHLYFTILSNTISIEQDFSILIALRAAGQKITFPKVINVKQKKLQEYIGVYAEDRIATNSNYGKTYRYVTIKNDTLFSQGTGGSKSPLLNIDKDLFVSKDFWTFTKFHRNNKGEIISLERYEEPIKYGPNKLESKTNLTLPKEKSAISLKQQTLELYKGKYDLGGGILIKVTIEGNNIYIQVTGQEREEIFAESETKFFLKSEDVIIEFIKNDQGVTKGLILNQGDKYEANKIE
jgi:CubicO group peptidase (beta-lactamase class C family)